MGYCLSTLSNSQNVESPKQSKSMSSFKEPQNTSLKEAKLSSSRTEDQALPKVSEQYHEDYYLQQAIELSLSPSYTKISHNDHLFIADTLLFDECALLVAGFVSNYNIPTVMINLCFDYFYIETTITTLKDRRNAALQLNDTHTVVEIEKLIFYKICGIEYNKRNESMLFEVITHWRVNEAIEEYKEYIIECIHQCIRKDNSFILQIILSCLYNELDSLDIIVFINYAAKRGAFECSRILLQNPLNIDWCQSCNPMNQLSPVVLFNAVKYQHDNLLFIHFIVNCLEITGIRFICDDVMEEVIRYDVVQIAKRIVSNRWHNISDDDVSFARFKDLKCHKWITERKKASHYYVENCGFVYDDCDYDEWKD